MRATAATWWAMSSIVTCSVSSYPSTTIASESPTRIMSTPASSATRADGASYAVTITSGGPAPLRRRHRARSCARTESGHLRTSTVQGTHGSRRQHGYAAPRTRTTVRRRGGAVTPAARLRVERRAALSSSGVETCSARSVPSAASRASRTARLVRRRGDSRRGRAPPPEPPRGRRAVSGVQRRAAAGEVVPAAVDAHLDDVARELVVRGAELARARRRG